MGGGTQRTDGERKHMDAKGMVYIDGRNVAASEVDPARHRFLGMFREPGIPSEGRGPKCRCGMLLMMEDEELTHWQQGHWDVPQYETIRQEGSR